MRRWLALLGSTIFLVIAPGTLAGFVPWWISRWELQAPLLGLPWIRIAGVVLIAASLAVLLDSFARFALQGLGTPAPVFPTKHLVVTGLYRYVRNPMYVAVFSLIEGQGLFFGNRTVIEYGAIVATGFVVFVMAYEEPTLRSTFGEQYRRYCSNVPRWIPRLRPWRAGDA